MGVVGLETAFPVLYAGLVQKQILPLEKLIRLLSENPRRRFGLPENGFSVWDLAADDTVDPAKFLSLGRATPFAGRQVRGRCLMTVCGDRVVYLCK